MICPLEVTFYPLKSSWGPLVEKHCHCTSDCTLTLLKQRALQFYHEYIVLLSLSVFQRCSPVRLSSSYLSANYTSGFLITLITSDHETPEDPSHSAPVLNPLHAEDDEQEDVLIFKSDWTSIMTLTNIIKTMRRTNELICGIWFPSSDDMGEKLFQCPTQC